MMEPDWSFLGEDVARLLRTADRLQRAREDAKRFERSGRLDLLQEVLMELEDATREARKETKQP